VLLALLLWDWGRVTREGDDGELLLAGELRLAESRRVMPLSSSGATRGSTNIFVAGAAGAGSEGGSSRGGTGAVGGRAGAAGGGHAGHAGRRST